jgi:outer membrane protein TolC
MKGDNSMWSRLSVVLIPIVTLCVPAPVSAQVARPHALTADEAARRAVATSPELRARERSVTAADAEVDRARVGYAPRLTLLGRYTRLSPIDEPVIGPLVAAPGVGLGPIPPGTQLFNAPFSFPTVLDQYLLQANVTVPLSDYVFRISQGYSAAKHSRRAAELELEAQKLRAAADARLLYYDAARARAQASIASQALEQARAHLTATEAGFEVRRVSRADVLRAESQVASAELLLERAVGLGRVSDDRLRTMLHDPPDRQYEISEDLLAAAPPRLSSTLEQDLSQAWQNRPELRALDANIASLDEQSRSADAGNLPRVDAFGNAYYANPHPRAFPQEEKWRASWDVGIQVTWSPNDALSSSAASNALDAKRAELEARKSALRDALRTEVATARQALVESRAAIATSERRVAAAEEALRARGELYNFGRATSLEVLDAQTELLRARLELVEAHATALGARVRLDYALGREVVRRTARPSS